MPFRVEASRVGWVRPVVADTLVRMGDVFHYDGIGISLANRLETFEDRSSAMADAGEALVQSGHAPGLRGELYGLKNHWHDPALATVDRGVVTAFGLRAYGVHLNGWTREHVTSGNAREPELWIGRRSKAMNVAPGKLDNMVAGGQPYGLSLIDNVIKEAAEEADIPAALARTAKPTGCITYVMETDDGLKPDVLFCYDLEVPNDFTPVNTDGETASFQRLPARDVGKIIATSDDFKFNCALVVAHFLLRHGLLTPDSEADYEAIATGLVGSAAART